MRIISHYPYYAQLWRTLARTGFKRLMRRHCQGYDKMVPFIHGKVGLEIGGPSSLFKGNHLIPVYDRCRAVDSANFSEKTVWTREREREVFGAALRESFIADATDMSSVADATYDFVLACHVLEHVANPLRALREWTRIVKVGGAVLVILPYKTRTFDNRRPFTTMQHLIDDFDKGTPESDLTHLDEILELHDWRRDPGGGGPEEFRLRSLDNATNRCMHQHVYSRDVLRECLAFCGMAVVNLVVEYPYHLVGMGQRR